MIHFRASKTIITNKGCGLIHRKDKSVLRSILGRQGFSLAETLMTILLMSIALVTVTSGASVIQNAYHKITLKSEAISLISTVTTSINADLRSANKETVNKSGEDIWFYSRQRKIVMTVFDNNGKIYYKKKIGNGVGDNVIIASEGLYSKGKLTAEIEFTQYPHKETDPSKKDIDYFTYEITVKSSAGQELEHQEVSVRAF